MADDAEPVEVVDDPTKTEEVEGDAVAAAESSGEGKEPKPGTPDKALQKMQQELGNVTRQLAALTEKKETDGALSQADKDKVAKAQQRIYKIRQFVGRPDREDLPSEVDPVAETVLELSEKAGEHDKLKGELAATQARLKRLENDRTWEIVRIKYAGLDVDAIWTKAQADALETLGESGNDDSVTRLASRWFEERCEAAKKRKQPDESANNKTSAGSTYKVGTAQRTAPQLSDEEEVLAMARQLVRET